MATRKPYPSDVSDQEWAFVAPYLALVREDAPQREHDLREVLNGLRWVVRTGSPWRYMPHDLPPWEAVYPRERLSGRLRRAQEQEGLEGACGGGHFGTPARFARQSGQRGRPKGAREALRGETRSDRAERRVGLRRSGIHGREGVRVRRRSRHPARSGQARGGQARLRALAKEMGGRTRFCMGLALSAIGEGLREAARDARGVAPRRIRLPLSPEGGRNSPHRFITRSRSGANDCLPLLYPQR